MGGTGSNSIAVMRSVDRLERASGSCHGNRSSGRPRSDPRASVFDGGELPLVVPLIEDVDISTLDENHGLPNMDFSLRPRLGA